MDLKDRKREFNIDNMTPEEVEKLSIQIGGKIRDLVDKAVESANRILSIYGMKCKMQIVIDEPEKIDQLKL